VVFPTMELKGCAFISRRQKVIRVHDFKK